MADLRFGLRPRRQHVKGPNVFFSADKVASMDYGFTELGSGATVGALTYGLAYRRGRRPSPNLAQMLAAGVRCWPRVPDVGGASLTLGEGL
jgi:hypothetical protein